METLERTRGQTGRPRSFDRNAALAQAMLTFWRHGYESTSISDLTAAMGITPPSLYAAFGDKKRLFLETVQLYLSAQPPQQMIAAAPTAREAASRLLTASVEGFTGETTPTGCLLATSALSCSPAANDVQAELASIRRGIEAALRARFEGAVETGELPTGTDTDALAGHGATREKLLRIADSAMKAWPT